MNRPIVGALIKKLTPRGLLLFLLAVILLIGFVVWNGGITIDKDGLTIEQEVTDETITDDHVVGADDSTDSGLRPARDNVEPS